MVIDGQVVSILGQVVVATITDIGTQHQLMAAPQQLKGPGGIGVQRIGVDLEGFGAAHKLRFTRGFVRERSPAHDIALQLVGVALPVAGFDFQQPIVIETLLDPGEVLGAFTVGIRPLGGRVHGALEVGSAAIAVVQRQLAKT